MPLVEAGMAGAPIVCSDLPIHRAVAAPWAVFVDADSEPAASAAVKQAIAMPRADAGAYRQRFSWPQIAQRVARLAGAE